ncbi:aminotransferase class IV [Clostridium grantii]|uniref:4-amino-4-deoxychorismate lyase n=1 Tax=Clostridium grantii DSM 8605 TaxID=1121316 RepID=A0A1M5QJ11_9CLOT|nr:aminotransferase class IV [Clostridium grantii]SHH13861.1 4-amino-4-deoxychorismate lyase [Clostridium grantii DSM 8605]
MFLSLNGELIEEKDMKIFPLGEDFMYGYGLFETVKIQNNKTIFMKEHVKRLLKGCIILDLDIEWNYNDIENFASELIKRNGVINGALKIIYCKNIKGNNLIIIWKDIVYNRECYEKGFKLCFCDYKKNPYSPLVYLKTNNYLDNIFNKKRIQAKGYDEGIFLNVNNKVCEGTFTNIFFVKNSIIYTPSRECGLLEGIIREKVINLARELRIELIIKEIEGNDLLSADEIFITNSLMEIMPVSRLENKELSLKINYITKTLMKNLED